MRDLVVPMAPLHAPSAREGVAIKVRRWQSQRAHDTKPLAVNVIRNNSEAFVRTAPPVVPAHPGMSCRKMSATSSSRIGPNISVGAHWALKELWWHLLVILSDRQISPQLQLQESARTHPA